MIGIKNPNSLCYIISVLQALSRCNNGQFVTNYSENDPSTMDLYQKYTAVVNSMNRGENQKETNMLFVNFANSVFLQKHSSFTRNHEGDAFEFIMWFTAFAPDPPTPITFMRANASTSGSTFGIMI